jgi:putative acetyltransferase
VSKPELGIRAGRPNDVDVIGQIIDAAFEGKPYAAGDEAELVEALRSQNALSVSLVAEWEGVVVGQIVTHRHEHRQAQPGGMHYGPWRCFRLSKATELGRR